jgi:hypothetical protein
VAEVRGTAVRAARAGVDIFRLLALLLAMRPLIFLMTSPRAGNGRAAAMH